MAEEPVVESLGFAERRARVQSFAVSPGTGDYPFRLIMGFGEVDGTWIIDPLHSKARKVEAVGFENDHLSWPSFIGADGKVFSSCARGGLSIYDPVADSIKLVRPIAGARWLRGMAIGPDGAVYVADYPTGSAARYDPATGKTTDFGRQGGPFEIDHIYGYSVGCDGRYVYTAVGKIPWYVVAYDTRTSKQKNLMQFESVDHPEIHQRGKQVFLDVKFGSPAAGQAANATYRLFDGQLQSVDSIPRFDDSYVPGKDHPQPKIQTVGRSLPMVKAGATLRVQLPGREWSELQIPVAGEQLEIQRIAPLGNGQLIVATGPYGNVHRFDPSTRSFHLLANPAGKNVYDLLASKSVLYFCGYPNGVLGSLGQVDNLGGAATVLGSWHDSVGSKHAVRLVEGADGRIYSGNHNERESTGGALGWYDPSSGELGGLHFPNDDCEYLTTAMKGRFIVYASDFSLDPAHPEIKPRDGKLMFFDTTTQRIVREISPLSSGSAGVVVEAKPGILVGVGRHDKLPQIYKVEVATGRVLQRDTLPAPAPRFIARGPDGKVYFFLKGSLVRVDAETLTIETLCEAEPGRMAFLGTDLYIGGTSQLRRVARVAK